MDSRQLPNQKVLYGFLIGIAAVGCLFVLLALAKPHRTGVVTSVGRVSEYGYRTGMGRHAAKGGRFAADVQVRVKGTGETETVYYRTGSREAIPQVGDEVEFAYSLGVGNAPYPQMWAMYTGAILLGLDLIVFLVCQVIRRRQRRGQEGQKKEA